MLLLDLLSLALETGPRPDERRINVLTEETVVSASLEETWSFFSDAANLERLTPGWLNFTIRTPPPIEMRVGTEIDYTILLYGFPIPWKTRIDVWEPGIRFVDRQISGPYLWWNHEHRFEPLEGAQTRVMDRVEFLPRARWISNGFVSRDVRRIFEFRRRKLEALFAHGAAEE
jgi:ligand-binding SRPBCC domain-containing protein